MRIWSPKLLEAKVKYNIKAFMTKYPWGLLLILRKKMELILTRSRIEPSPLSMVLHFGNTIKIANTSGIRIGDLIRDRTSPTNNPGTAPRSRCDKSYYGERGSCFSIRISEHRAKVRHH